MYKRSTNSTRESIKLDHQTKSYNMLQYELIQLKHII